MTARILPHSQDMARCLGIEVWAGIYYAFTVCLPSDCQLFVPAASEVRSILEDDAASVSKESDNYWVLTAALRRYVDNEGKGQLPIEVCMPPKLCALVAVYSGVCRAVLRGARS